MRVTGFRQGNEQFLFHSGELKSFAEYLPEEKKAEFTKKLENAKEEGFALWDEKEKAEQERDELKRKNGKISFRFVLRLF